MSGAFLEAAFHPDAFFTNLASGTGGEDVDVRLLFLSVRPRFSYGSGSNLVLRLPTTAYDYAIGNIGGDIESDAGLRTAFFVRRDELLTFDLRFFESEWTAVQAFLNFAQTGEAFTWYPDALDTTISKIVRLVSPVVGTTYAARPHPEYPKVQLLTLTVVRSSFIPAPAVIPPPDDTLTHQVIFDFDADDAIAITTPLGWMVGTYHGVVSVPNRISGMPTLILQGADRPGWHSRQTELNNHALIRAFGQSNNNPMLAQLDERIDGLTGLTLIAVHRPGAGVTHGFPFQLGDHTPFFADGSNLALGIVSGAATIGGWRRGSLLLEPGEFDERWNGVSFFEPVNYPTVGVPYNPVLGHYQEWMPVRDEDNVSGDRFNVTVIRINASGVIRIMQNGILLPFAYTAPGAPFSLQNIRITSSSAGSLDLSGGQAWEWTRMTAYSRWLTDFEARAISRTYGLRYTITVA